ncbi:MAG: polysaccharide deacetylase family protein, partial [Myxococcales bacterium]|nr:polysaccharide deacetylase family protein [Myxococcales bacterium]
MSRRRPFVAFILAVCAPFVLAPPGARAELVYPAIADYGSDGGGYPAGVPLPPRTLSLTIDDGPGDLSVALGDWLHARGIRATFFVVGTKIEARPDHAAIFDRWLEQGHRIANHSENHVRLDLDLAGAPDELRLVADRIAAFLPDGMHLFRPPFGRWRPEIFDALTVTDEFDAMMGAVKYEINAEDWNCFESGRSAAECADDYLALIAARPDENGIIIVHEHIENDQPTYHLEVIQALVEGVEAMPGAPFVWVPVDAVPGVSGGLTLDPAVAWSGDFGDAAGYAAPALAGSLRAGDLDGDGDDDVCAREPAGVVCALSDGSALGPATLWSASFSDAAGFGEERHALSLALGDLDGDGRADVCLRGAAGVLCEHSDGAGFVPSGHVLPDFSDAAGFGDAESRY